MEIKYKIGQKFKPRRKRQDTCTIIDILRTYNSVDQLVKIRYVTSHEFLGQLVFDYDVLQTTIDMGDLCE